MPRLDGGQLGAWAILLPVTFTQPFSDIDELLGDRAGCGRCSGQWQVQLPTGVGKRHRGLPAADRGDFPGHLTRKLLTFAPSTLSVRKERTIRTAAPSRGTAVLGRKYTVLLDLIEPPASVLGTELHRGERFRACRFGPAVPHAARLARSPRCRTPSTACSRRNWRAANRWLCCRCNFRCRCSKPLLKPSRIGQVWYPGQWAAGSRRVVRPSQWLRRQCFSSLVRAGRGQVQVTC